MSNYAYIRAANSEENFNIQREKARFKSIKIEKLFMDIGVSGSTLERSGLNDLLSTVKNKDNIYISDISRLARNTQKCYELIISLHDKGIDVFSLQDLKKPLYKILKKKMSYIIPKPKKCVIYMRMGAKEQFDS